MNSISQKNKQKKNIINFVKVEFKAERLYCIALDCTGVPNKMTRVCNSFITEKRMRWKNIDTTTSTVLRIKRILF